jgi:hypothetical protein
MRLRDQAVLLGVGDLADPVQLQCPLQVQLGEVDLAYRGKVDVTVPAAQLVPGGVAGLGELVQPEPVVADPDSDVGAAGQAKVGDTVSQRRLRHR